MAALPGLAVVVGHGGLAGAVVEVTVALAVVGILVAVWLRERRRPGEDEPGGLRDDDEEPGTPRTGAPLR